MQGSTRRMAPSRPRAAAKPDVAGDVLRSLETFGEAVELDVEGSRFRVTHLERVYWPAVPTLRQPVVTKRMFLRYLAHRKSRRDIRRAERKAEQS